MICPHVHLRDFNEEIKETILNGFEVAYLSGIDAVFEMPNTSPMLISESIIQERLKKGYNADKLLKAKYQGFKIFHGIYAGLTCDENQIKEMIACYNKYEQVVGLKVFFGKSTGNLSVVETDEQKFIWKNIVKYGYKGLIAGHCEKQSLIKDHLWKPENIKTHTIVRPPESEIESVKDQIRFAKQAGFEGTFHVCHISVPEALENILYMKNKVPFRITCGITPHHAIFYDEIMDNENGIFLKMNPPLRPEYMQKSMLKSLFDEKIDWIETDHAPHTKSDKINKYASGIPGLPYYPFFIDYLIDCGINADLIQKITHDNIIDAFGLNKKKISNSYGKNRLNNFSIIAEKYDFNPFQKIIK